MRTIAPCVVGLVLVVGAASAQPTTKTYDATNSRRVEVRALVVLADGTYATHRARLADLAAQQALPTCFGSPGELSLNLKTARALRLALPQTLMVRADHVIE